MYFNNNLSDYKPLTSLVILHLTTYIYWTSVHHIVFKDLEPDGKGDITFAYLFLMMR